MRTSLALPAILVTIAVTPAWAQAPSASDLGLFVYPAKEQTKEQQAKDEQECYAWANEQSTIDPTASKANSDSAAKVAQAKTDSATAGAAVGGAARGAAGGAVIGAIAGDAGEGAAIGAVTGAVAGRRARKKASQQAGAQAKQQTEAASAQKTETFKKAMSACLEGRGYTVK
jgi:outer membrane lipoprotein SlyB